MSTDVVVIGAGYAGAGAVKAVETAAGSDIELTWVSERDYHLVLHEVHRVIRTPAVESKVTIPVEQIKSPSTEFRQGRAVDVDTDTRTVELEDGPDIEYDYLLLAVGSATAFYGIDGLEEHSLTLKSLDDAREINAAVREAAADATANNPARVLVGGAGLSGIQAAGEIAEWREDHRAPVEITLIEGLDEVFPGNDPELQGALRRRLQAADIAVRTGEFITRADDNTVYIDGGEESPPEELAYDVLVWTGGITGQDMVSSVNVDRDERSDRVYTDSDFRTSNDRVFAIGDTALIDQGDDAYAPPTAQAAWQAAEVAGENLARAARGAPLRTWSHVDKGTLISIGERAVAHDVEFVPINTFGGPGAAFLKKAVAVRWIASVSSLGRALRAWSDM